MRKPATYTPGHVDPDLVARLQRVAANARIQRTPTDDAQVELDRREAAREREEERAARRYEGPEDYAGGLEAQWRERVRLETEALDEFNTGRILHAAHFILAWREDGPASVNREASALADRLEPPDPWACEHEPDDDLPHTWKWSIV